MKTEIIEVISGRGTGMALASIIRLLKWVQENPGRTVYVNFELPKAAKATIEKYATIEKIRVEK